MGHKINGHHCTNGYHDGGRGFYLVEIRGGRIFDADGPCSGDELHVRQWGNDAPVLTNGCWEFWPDDADLARLRILPIQMIQAALT